MDNYNKNKHKMSQKPESKLKLVSSASDQNVFFTYVCMVNDLKPTDEVIHNKEQNKISFNYINGESEERNHEDQLIQVERSKALHELIESHRKDDTDPEKEHNEADSSTTYPTTTSGEESEISENEYRTQRGINPNILKLTKMKWLTEDQEGSPDSSSPLLSPTNSSTSTNGSNESDDEIEEQISVNDKYLSTILRLDKEHNMFGLSNITIVRSRPSRKLRKDDEMPAFHQTAVVQICCGKKCCKHRSKTDLPASLKWGGCRRYGVDSCDIICPGTCAPLCVACAPAKCMINCANSFGMKISVNRKPKYEPSPIELTPRSSCILQKPISARSCHHLPQCVPPSSCFPYLMPCFWPARSGAPCNTPARCFHNPPCRAPRRSPAILPPEETCPSKCDDKAAKTKCQNLCCFGNNPETKKEIESRFGHK
ncbi:uncharacterized protein LOC131854890 [Achroia grisella]|uniref:uncharacterized protein LOC131854890 n=1 Tax=Achroia grisella TaxID=688607 RepID=UPI0027D293C7|nr:uncharacterized protein LOC131854890 [Achroia grisella]